MLDSKTVPHELFNLLNPAFCGEIIRRALIKYRKYSLDSMPFSLSFLILPIILHKDTREKIDYGTRVSFPVWLSNNPEILINFEKRTKQLVQPTILGLRFLLEQNQIKIDDNAKISIIHDGINKKYDDIENESTECFKKSESVGRWFAKIKNEETIYFSLGVRP